MKLTLNRKWIKPNYTIGTLSIDDKYFCDTLEDRVVDKNKNGKFDGSEKKIAGESAIPYGTYEIVYNFSPKFKRNLPRLLNVPHFEGILIHPGNSPKDTAGCILVGKNTIVGGLTQSKAYSGRLNDLIKAAQTMGDRIFIEII